jgi:hypothetical protein
MYAILGRSSEPEYADRVIAFRRTVMSRISDEPGAVAA